MTLGRRLTATCIAAGLFGGVLAAAGDPAARLPIPSAASQRTSGQRIREIFSGDFAQARTAKEQAGLAEELIGHSRDTRDASDAFVLLDTARNLAVEAGNVAVTDRAIAELGNRYDIDGENLRQQALVEIAGRASGPALAPVVDGLVGVAAQAAARGDVQGAEDLLKAAATAARKARDKQRQDSVLGELKRIREQEKLADKIAPLLKRLAADPADREAAKLLGKHRCFVDGDWDAGLPLLARGDDESLARLAGAELRAGGDPLALGDAWWAFAEGAKGPDRGHAVSRAADHYRAGLATLSGLDKVRIEKRIAEADREAAPSSGAGGGPRPANAIFWLDATAGGAVANVEGKPLRTAGHAGELAGAWKDLQMRTLVAAPPDAAAAPLFAAGAIGGHPALVFKGGQRLVARGPLPAAGALLLVLQPAPQPGDACVLGSVAAPLVDAWVRANGSVWFTVFPRGGEMLRINTDAAAVRPGEPGLLTVCWPKPFVLRINGRQKVNRDDVPPTVLGGEQFVIGAGDSGGRYPFSGAIGELLVLDRVPAEAELAKVETQLMQKWRIRP